MQEQVLATYGLVAQLVAQLLCKQKVTGSSPVPSTRFEIWKPFLKRVGYDGRPFNTDIHQFIGL